LSGLGCDIFYSGTSIQTIHLRASIVCGGFLLTGFLFLGLLVVVYVLVCQQKTFGMMDGKTKSINPSIHQSINQSGSSRTVVPVM
jgi:hypothetical protein